MASGGISGVVNQVTGTPYGGGDVASHHPPDPFGMCYVPPGKMTDQPDSFHSAHEAEAQGNIVTRAWHGFTGYLKSLAENTWQYTKSLLMAPLHFPKVLYETVTGKHHDAKQEKLQEALKELTKPLDLDRNITPPPNTQNPFTPEYCALNMSSGPTAQSHPIG